LTKFVTVYADVLPRSTCDAIIRRFDQSETIPGRTASGFDPNRKLSRDLTLNNDPSWRGVVDEIAAAVEPPLVDYVQRFRRCWLERSLPASSFRGAPSLWRSNSRKCEGITRWRKICSGLTTGSASSTFRSTT
jgi:hypothetical protein